jgi:periplasmic divalent cation tolerance protein
MSASGYQLVLTTCANIGLAEALARALVEDRLAACVNILPSMQSVYRWKGQIESASEQLLVIKTRTIDYASVQRRIGELHSYELPEVIAIPIVGGLPAYLAWLEDPDGISR